MGKFTGTERKGRRKFSGGHEVRTVSKNGKTGERKTMKKGGKALTKGRGGTPVQFLILGNPAKHQKRLQNRRR